ncbi:MAG: fasciclin domain-containing protein [Leptolyngbyaceae cyanobacterium SM2_5_2]|nr:fasciclin domain-containing protein [Leptolyngbyaceae cyanobacterium SM2_5_2]
MPSAVEGETIVDVAANHEDFRILMQAIEAAELTETLEVDGPVTVFAPTDEAFEALPAGTLDELLKPENQDLLRQVLSYHVLPLEVTTADATTGEVPTAAGRPLALRVDETTGDVMVNEARVIEADIQASNGVIHAVDKVILPSDVAL